MSEVQGHPDPSRWWKHRRRGYYLGKWWAIVQTFGWIALGAHNPNALEALGAVVGWSYGICATLIVSYFGNNIAEAWAGRVKP